MSSSKGGRLFSSQCKRLLASNIFVPGSLRSERERAFSGRNTSDDLGLEVDGHDAFDTKSHGDLLEGLVGDTLLVVVLHVLEAGELGL